MRTPAPPAMCACPSAAFLVPRGPRALPTKAASPTSQDSGSRAATYSSFLVTIMLPTRASCSLPGKEDNATEFTGRVGMAARLGRALFSSWALGERPLGETQIGVGESLKPPSSGSAAF